MYYVLKNFTFWQVKRKFCPFHCRLKGDVLSSSICKRIVWSSEYFTEIFSIINVVRLYNRILILAPINQSLTAVHFSDLAWLGGAKNIPTD